MIRDYVRPGIGLLILLAAVTACAAPAAPEAVTADNPPVVVETVLPAVVATATAVSEPTSTEAATATATAQPTVPAPLPVESPEKDVATAEAQAVAQATVDEATGPTDEQQWVLDGLPSLGPAPELRNDVWLNSEPLRLAELRGKVVLLDMWTFG